LVFPGKQLLKEGGNSFEERLDEEHATQYNRQYYLKRIAPRTGINVGKGIGTGKRPQQHDECGSFSWLYELSHGPTPKFR
jgi:hypothetical protein